METNSKISSTRRYSIASMTARAIWNNAVDKAKESISDGMSMLGERERLILLAGKSELGWKTVTEYLQHQLAVDERDGKKVRRAEERAERAEKAFVSKTSKSKSFVNRSLSSSHSLFAGSRAQANSYNSDRRLCLRWLS